MKIFPQNSYSIELNNDSTTSISELKKHTLSKEQFVANWNSQTFLGKINENEFEIKLSKKLYGELCVLNGKLENKKGAVKIRTGKIFKIIFVIIVLFCLSGIITAIVEDELELVFPSIIAVLIMRFIFLELGFRLVSKSAINKLIETIGIKKTNKTA